MSHRLPLVSASTEIARRLRRSLTPQERILWAELRSAKLGVSFRRQEPIGRYVVDFVCYKSKLIVELDGSQHLDSAADKVRDAFLMQEGFVVLRFWNSEVNTDLSGVLEHIQTKVTERQV